MEFIIAALCSAITFGLLSRLKNSKRVNDLDIIFEDYGDVVGIRKGGDSRIFKLPPKRIRKERIVKIQQGSNINLITKGGSSYLIFALDGDCEKITKRAKELFPEAEVVVVGN